MAGANRHDDDSDTSFDKEFIELLRWCNNHFGCVIGKTAEGSQSIETKDINDRKANNTHRNIALNNGASEVDSDKVLKPSFNYLMSFGDVVSSFSPVMDDLLVSNLPRGFLGMTLHDRILAGRSLAEYQRQFRAAVNVYSDIIGVADSGTNQSLIGRQVNDWRSVTSNVSTLGHSDVSLLRNGLEHRHRSTPLPVLLDVSRYDASFVVDGGSGSLLDSMNAFSLVRSTRNEPVIGERPLNVLAIGDDSMFDPYPGLEAVAERTPLVVAYLRHVGRRESYIARVVELNMLPGGLFLRLRRMWADRRNSFSSGRWYLSDGVGGVIDVRAFINTSGVSTRDRLIMQGLSDIAPNGYYWNNLGELVLRFVMEEVD